jgi:predicted N-formylglutamate amidohydrolase
MSHKGPLKFDKIILSCEHGGYEIPRRYLEHYDHWQGKLKTHCGYDRGALNVAEHLAEVFGWRLTSAKVSRLLIDLNRPLDNDSLFSVVSAAFSEKERREIIHHYHAPYWQRVEEQIGVVLKRPNQKILHLSVHSFTPVIRGVRRDCDLGLLFDPLSTLEKDFCVAWHKALEKSPGCNFRVRQNYPYRGDAPALTTSLRQKFGPQRYAGIEIEINQKLARRRETLETVALALEHSLRGLV